LQRRMCRMVALDQHGAGLFTTARAPGDLDEQLSEVLLAAEVGAEQTTVGIEDHHQCYAREMMPLGEHLRAQQHTGHARMCDVHQTLQAAGGARGVTVDAQYREILEGFAQEGLAALRAHADAAQVSTAAGWTPARQRLAGLATVAAQSRR